ncbi:MAG: hypothetical protein OEX19_02395 [Gammaproteobacteria bacterium]|nr:hypothetical protein [Gammaproteobacteria bacterium]
MLKTSFYIVLFVVFYGCTEINTAPLEITNDQDTLSGRVSLSNEVLTIETTTSSQKPGIRAKAKDELTLTLVATVTPPSHEGQVLQANEIIIKGNRAYVGYNVKGETYLGGVDVFDISDPGKPVLTSSAILNNSDVNGLAIQGNTLYLATASGNASLTSPAALEIIELDGLDLTDNHQLIDLKSYAATDVDISGNTLYVTSGADGGQVVQIDANTLEVNTELALEDARGVDTDGLQVGVVAGTTARLLSFDSKTNENEGDYLLDGATIPFSKSTIEIKKGMAVLGLGDGGTQVVCLSDGRVLEHITPPVVAGLDSSVTVTNAATAYKRSIFISNGEAGVYVAMTDSNISSNKCELDNLELVGKLQLDMKESVNHVTYRNDVLFVAAGTGGLQIVQIEDTKATEDDDDK